MGMAAAQHFRRSARHIEDEICPKALSEECPRKNRYEVGGIAYWSPDHQFAVFYRQDGQSIPSSGIIPIAKVDAGTDAFNVRGSVKVTVELAKTHGRWADWVDAAWSAP